jgi:hypothetical protein
VLTLILAASLSVQQVLPKFEDFCNKAELEIDYPLTEQMLTKQVVNEKYEQVLVRVQEKYVLKYLRGRVKSFTDLRENIAVRLTRLDPHDMQGWSEQPCLIDEAEASEIAKRIFRRLGFDEKDFDPVEVHRYRWQPSPADPDHVLWLPVFMVKWYEQGHPRDQALPPHVQMDISGTTKKLAYYLDATTLKSSLLQRGIPAPELTGTNVPPPPSAENLLPVCERFLKAAGIQLDAGDRKEVKAFAAEWATPTLVVVQRRYVFKFVAGRLSEFWDNKEHLRRLLMEERMPEVKSWAGRPTMLTAAQAEQTATKVFAALGLDQRRFSPPKVQRYDPKADDPDQPGTTLTLPASYSFRWVGKRPWWARGGMPDVVDIEVSGDTGNVVYYSHAPSNLRLW